MNKQLKITGEVQLNKASNHFEFFDISIDDMTVVFKKFIDLFMEKVNKSKMGLKDLKNKKLAHDITIIENKVFVEMIRKGDIKLNMLCAMALNNLKVDFREYTRQINAFHESKNKTDKTPKF